ncbi:hypothetical protein ABZ752_15320 [Streptomyces roseifaciens]
MGGEGRLWTLIEDQGERQPLTTLSELRAVVELFQAWGAGGEVEGFAWARACEVLHDRRYAGHRGVMAQ